MQITRNVVHMLLRSAEARAILDRGFTHTALDAILFTQAEKRQLFDALSAEENMRVVEYLRGVATLVRVAPGQTVFREGERADDFYIVRLGFVKIHQVGPDGREMVLAYSRKGEYFGEVAFLSNLRPRIAEVHPDGPARAGRRLASCTALDHVELVRVEGRHFKRFLEDPKNKYITDKLERRCIELLEKQFGRQLAPAAPVEA
jgi:CRP-like cAMP-binding protein